mmetsp:Transcript_117347/g.233898  ORF Transcript_117347/g.233898 Transcript_117347/m.233898 type:complete len:229 (-) Transcript_117347:214-900(-)
MALQAGLSLLQAFQLNLLTRAHFSKLSLLALLQRLNHLLALLQGILAGAASLKLTLHGRRHHSLAFLLARVKSCKSLSNSLLLLLNGLESLHSIHTLQVFKALELCHHSSCGFGVLCSTAVLAGSLGSQEILQRELLLGEQLFQLKQLHLLLKFCERCLLLMKLLLQFRLALRETASLLKFGSECGQLLHSLAHLLVGLFLCELATLHRLHIHLDISSDLLRLFQLRG